MGNLSKKATLKIMGHSILLTAMLGIFSGTALAKNAAKHESVTGSCSKTTSAAYSACGYEAGDDYWITVGNCANIGDPVASKACKQEAKTTYRAEKQLCQTYRDGRDDFCDAIGEDAYEPEIDPAMFVNPDQIGQSIAPNPYFLLVPGRTLVYQIENEEIRVEVTNKTRVIEGVTCREVHDVVRVDGVIIEDTLDWYAQDIDGNVWYFGEISMSYEDGVLVNIDGSWTAGVDMAKPGYAMKAAPVIGESYRQEFALNNAEDGAEVISLTGEATVPAASCTQCLVTRDFSPIIPSLLEHKYYAAGVGFIMEIKPNTNERLELVEIIQN